MNISVLYLKGHWHSYGGHRRTQRPRLILGFLKASATVNAHINTELSNQPTPNTTPRSGTKRVSRKAALAEPAVPQTHAGWCQPPKM
jgi:hypothetical protein